SGPFGSTVVLEGRNFTDATGVSLCSMPASFTIESDARIDAIVPTGACDGTWTVTTGGGTGVAPTAFVVTGRPPTTTVDCTADTGALAGALAGAVAGATLTIQGSCQGEYVLTRSVTLQGAGAVLESRGTGQPVLTVVGGRVAVRLIGLTITGGYSVNGRAGGI